MNTEPDIEALYTRFGSMVYRRCRQMLGNEDEAIDATQEVFIKLIEMGNVEITAPSSLLYVIATRHCLNLLRSKRRKPEDANSELAYNIATVGGDKQPAARLMLDWLFGNNPESSKVIAVLHFLDGLTLEETAAEVGMSVSGVRRRLRIMRAQLEESGGLP